MRLIGLTVENFRCYAEPTSVRFNDLTALVGTNDVGKSTLMDALAIFFMEATLDKDDACKSGNPKEMRITCEFDRLPDEIVVDTDFPTSLEAEHLLSARGTFIIRKTYNGSLSKPAVVSTDAIAEHPTAERFQDLLNLKKTELTKRAEELGVNLEGIDKRKNAPIRAAIWQSADDLKKAEVPIALDSEVGKQVWTALQPSLPTFALFKSDRASSDQDAEAQDPLKAAIREAIKAVEDKLQQVQEFVEAEVKKIAEATVAKLREMDPSIAETLNPVVSTKKWDSLFTTSITGDNDIPLNKRGSGVKRLVLLNFFRAKAEKAAAEKHANSVIYAIEEPETSQHPRNQRMLLNALRDLSFGEGRQVIITTHTPMLARYLDEADLRFIQRREDGVRTIGEVGQVSQDQIANSLGVLADHNVKIFVGVEGVHDMSFLKGISRVLIDAGEDVPDLDKLELDGKLVFIPLGGSNLTLWASRLSPFNRPEFHICDRDNKPPAPPKYQDHINAINTRKDCNATATNKRELENYVHHKAIIEAYAEQSIEINFPGPFDAFDDVPTLTAQAVYAVNSDKPWADLKAEQQRKKESGAKRQINNTAVSKMTVARLAETDPDNEIRGWLASISAMMAAVDG